MLITCTYRGQEFIRIGYYVNNEYTDPELRENPPIKPDYTQVRLMVNFWIICLVVNTTAYCLYHCFEIILWIVINVCMVGWLFIAKFLQKESPNTLHHPSILRACFYCTTKMARTKVVIEQHGALIHCRIKAFLTVEPCILEQLLIIL